MGQAGQAELQSFLIRVLNPGEIAFRFNGVNREPCFIFHNKKGGITIRLQRRQLTITKAQLVSPR